MIGLAEGVIDVNSTIGCTGAYLGCGTGKPKCLDPGTFKLTEAIAHSCNTYFATVFRRTLDQPKFGSADSGLTAFNRYAASFGLGDKLGVDLPSEKRGNLPTSKYYRKIFGSKWQTCNIISNAIGQGEVETTIVQLANVMSTIANKGWYYTPHLIDSIEGGDEYALLEKFKEKHYTKGVADTVFNAVQDGMQAVMDFGTGSGFKIDGITVCGKTGTAQLRGESGYREQKIKAYQASFVGYFPAKKPIYSCIVVIARPVVAYYGAAVSGTVFAEIANKIYASSLQYHRAVNDPRNPLATDVPQLKSGNSKDVTYLLKQLNVRYQLNSSSEWVQADTSDQRLQVQRKTILAQKVPNVSGMSAKDAVYLLESRGLIVRLVGRGQVYSQSIAPGQSFVKGQLIQIKLH